MAIEIKVNKIKADIKEYYLHVRGVPKIGKTQLVYRMFMEKFGADNMHKGVLISMGAEDGYKACDDLSYIVVNDWDEYEEALEYLIDNKKELGVEMIALDTSDEFVRIACEEIKSRSVALGYTSKGKMLTMNKAFGGYNEGNIQLVLMMTDEIRKIKSYFGLITLGHTKEKEVTEKTGEKYLQLTAKLRGDYEYIFSSKADVVAVINLEKTYSSINVEENNKIKKKAGYLSDAKRKIYFRSDNYNVDCGSRFPNIEPSIDYDAKLFISTIEDAIQKSKINGKKFTKKEIKQQEKERDEEIEKKLIKRVQNEDDGKMDEAKEIIKETIANNPEALTDDVLVVIEEIVGLAEDGAEIGDAIDQAPNELIEKIVGLL